MLSDEPHDGVIDVRVVMSESISEVNDTAGVRDPREELRREAGKRGHGLADYHELTLYRRANQLVGAVGCKIHACERPPDSLAGFDDVVQ